MMSADSDKVDLSSPSQRVCGVVLAGAYAWSHSPFDRLMPRALLPVAGWPLIAYALEWLRGRRIRQTIVCTNRDTRTLQACLARYVPEELTNISYREDPMPRGPAG